MILGCRLFQECKEYGENDKSESNDVVPVNWFALEDCRNDKGEDYEGNRLLDDLKLHEGIRTAIDLRTNAVGWYHEGILEQCHAPTEKNDEDQWPVFDRWVHLLELEVSIPGECHEDIGDD